MAVIRERWQEHRRGLGLPDDWPPSGSPSLSERTLGGEDAEDLPKGTVGAVALDIRGNVACATSTGGRTNKNGPRLLSFSSSGDQLFTSSIVGRIGDTPSQNAFLLTENEPPLTCPPVGMGSGFWSEEWPIKPRWWRRLFDQRRTRSVAISGTGDGDVCITPLATVRFDVKSLTCWTSGSISSVKTRRMKWLLGCVSRTSLSNEPQATSSQRWCLAVQD
jgi:beta-aspartyl-peptidase (threonine type)